MGKRWVDTKEYETTGGRWRPEAHVFEERDGGVDQHRVVTKEGVTLASREEAMSYSRAMGLKWIDDNLS